MRIAPPAKAVRVGEGEWGMPTFKTETRWWMFWMARLFGKRVAKNIYMWRGKWWVCGEVSESDEEDLMTAPCPHGHEPYDECPLCHALVDAIREAQRAARPREEFKEFVERRNVQTSGAIEWEPFVKANEALAAYDASVKERRND